MLHNMVSWLDLLIYLARYFQSLLYSSVGKLYIGLII